MTLIDVRGGRRAEEEVRDNDDVGCHFGRVRGVQNKGRDGHFWSILKSQVIMETVT